MFWNKKFSYKMDDEERLYRCLAFGILLCEVLKNKMAEDYSLDYLVEDYFRNDERYREFIEKLIYTTSYIFRQIETELKTTYEWTDEIDELWFTYQADIENGIQEYLKLEDDDYVSDLIIDNYLFYISEDDALDQKWGIYDEHDNFVPENMYTYRFNDIFEVKRPDIVSRNIFAYKDIGIVVFTQVIKKYKLKKVKNVVQSFWAETGDLD